MESAVEELQAAVEHERQRANTDIVDIEAELKDAVSLLHLMRGWMEADTTRMAREYCQLLVLKQQAAVALHRATHDALHQRLLQVKGVEQPTAPLERFLAASPAISSARTSFDFLSHLCDRRRHILQGVVSAISNRPPQGRGVVVRSLVANARVVHQEDASCLLDITDAAQHQFDCIVCDQRTREGQMLQRWWDATHKLASVPAPMIVSFVKNFHRILQAAYGVPKDYSSHLAVFVERLVVPRVFLKISTPNVALTHADDLYRAQSRWLLRCHAREFGVGDEFAHMVHQGGLQAASGLLGDVELQVSSSDMLLALFRASQEVYRAMQLSPEARGQPLYLQHKNPLGSEAIGADQFFPLFLWACLHGQLQHINRVVHVLKQFISDDDRITELGYYLTCLEGAATFVVEADPDQLQPLFPSSV